jgi:excisionase family DNA binding protein
MIMSGNAGQLGDGGVTSFPDVCRRIARFMRDFGATEAPTALEKAAELADALLKADGERLLTYAEAAELTGRSRDTIAKAVQKRRLPNQGRRGAPRVRVSDLHSVFPARGTPNASASAYDVGADARRLFGVRSGESA